MFERIAESKMWNVIACLGFIILTVGIWTDHGHLIWKILVIAATLFQLNETVKLYKRK